MSSKTLTFTVPELLEKEIEVSSEIGYYDNKSEFLRDAVRTLLAARRDLRIAIASALYGKGEISLGRAVEIADVNYEDMKRILVERGIKIKRGVAGVKEMKSRVGKLSG